MTLRRDQRTTRELLEDYGTADVRDTERSASSGVPDAAREQGEPLGRRGAGDDRAGGRAHPAGQPWQRRMVARIVARERTPRREFDKYGFGRRW